MQAMTKPLVKICGITSAADAQLASRLGADYLGVIVEHPPSPRHVGVQQARDIFAATDRLTVAVVVNQSPDQLLRIADVLQPAALQLHGDESVQLVRELKARGLAVWAACSANVSGNSEGVRRRAGEMAEAGADAILLDARDTNESGIIYGGTGKLSDWRLAQSLVEDGLRVVLAGGLNPENVAAAVRAVAPWMVDVISGVEARKGVKDEEKVRRFIERARSVQR